MKINQIPDIYIEQYLLGELQEDLRKEIDEMIIKNSELNDRIIELKKSTEDILSIYPLKSVLPQIIKKMEIKNNPISGSYKAPQVLDNVKDSAGFTAVLVNTIKTISKQISLISARRYTLSIASAAVMILIVFIMMPGIRDSVNIKTPYNDTVRIKGLDSKLLLYKMKGREVVELKNFDSARQGDIIQVGYIAAGNYKHVIILSIDGRGAVTLHLPESTASGEKPVQNKRTLLNKSYELDDSPSFERFIMILSAEQMNPDEIIEKAKKLAISKESALNGLINTENDSKEFSIVLKKTE